jgi:hypothetical protein
MRKWKFIGLGSLEIWYSGFALFGPAGCRWLLWHSALTLCLKYEAYFYGQAGFFAVFYANKLGLSINFSRCIEALFTRAKSKVVILW